jgi:hypothetical protein
MKISSIGAASNRDPPIGIFFTECAPRPEKLGSVMNQLVFVHVYWKRNRLKTLYKIVVS